MAKANVVRYGEVLLTFETTPGSGTFDAFCSINGDKAIQLTRELTESRVPDCDDPEAPDQLDFTADVQRCTISGQGVVHRDNLTILNDIYNASTPFNAKAVIYNQAGGLTITGEFWLEDMSFNATRKQNAEGTIAGRFGNFTTAINV